MKQENKKSFQYFKKEPDKEILNEVLKAFCLVSLNDKRVINRNYIKIHNVVENLIDIGYKLEEYYYEYKFIRLMEALNEKNAINILRHFVKIFGYNIICSSCYKRRELNYRIEKIEEEKKTDIIKSEKGEFILFFN